MFTQNALGSRNARIGPDKPCHIGIEQRCSAGLVAIVALRGCLLGYFYFHVSGRCFTVASHEHFNGIIAGFVG